jgi:hypothetical protein
MDGSAGHRAFDDKPPALQAIGSAGELTRPLLDGSSTGNAMQESILSGGLY